MTHCLVKRIVKNFNEIEAQLESRLEAAKLKGRSVTKDQLVEMVMDLRRKNAELEAKVVSLVKEKEEDVSQATKVSQDYGNVSIFLDRRVALSTFAIHAVLFENGEPKIFS